MIPKLATSRVGLTGLIGLLSISLCCPLALTAEPGSVRSEILKTGVGDLVLTQELVVEAAVAEVWRAYTTNDGWTAWASPVAEVDLRAGGTIRTHYEASAKIGDAGTNTLQIVNYVPERVLTLRAELSERWPDVMKEDAENLMNVIVFEPVGQEKTKILSYGVGYRDVPAYDELMKFFIPANEGLLQKLKQYLEAKGPAPSQMLHTFSTEQRLTVEVRDTGGAVLAGVTLSLCPTDAQAHAVHRQGRDCLWKVSDSGGAAQFDEIKHGTHVLAGELDGFASTAISPLSIGGEDPVAPDQVVLILNPVCYDC